MKIIIFISLIALCAADKEYVDHGGRSPHEKLEKDHYKDGVHNTEFDHQSVLGSKKDAEEFQHLSPEESKRRLEIMAKKMDLNGDEIIDKDELAVWIENQMRNLDDEEINERYSEIDTNHDGAITFEEYKKDAFGGDDEDEDSETEGGMDPDDQKLLDEDRRYFTAADRNQDGKLDKTEFAAFQNPEAFEFMHVALVEQTLNDKDSNKDGKIDLSEFMSDYTDQTSEWAVSEKERFASSYDKNNDGSLDKQEMTSWLIPSLATTASDEADHLINGADSDKSGGLSIEEIVDHHDLFVGSEATNYGEHLEKMSHDEL